MECKRISVFNYVTLLLQEDRLLMSMRLSDLIVRKDVRKRVLINRKLKIIKNNQKLIVIPVKIRINKHDKIF